MALEQKLSLKLAQKLVMTPSLQQAIKLLQMTRMELEGVLNQEMVENPLLEENLESTEEEAPAADEETPETDTLSDIDLDAYFGDYAESWEGQSQGSVYEERQGPPLENTLTRSDDLYDHLLFQLHMLDLDARQKELTEFIVGNLDADGFLVASFEELQRAAALSKPSEGTAMDSDNGAEAPDAASEPLFDAAEIDAEADRAEDSDAGSEDRALDVEASQDLAESEASSMAAGDERFSRQEVEEALSLVRGLDPPGIACWTLQESLLQQLIARGDDESSRAYLLVRDRWDAFTHRKFEAIAKSLGIPLQELRPVVEDIAGLETRPGRPFNNERTHYVEPDVHVVKVGGEYVIQLNDNGLPRLRISRAYRKMLRTMRSQGSEAEAQAYIKDKMRSALWLIKSLDQRQRTIYKVAASIVQQQKDFLEHGVDHLRPMVLRDVAEDIEMHESTVSRVVSNKYIHTPRGLLPMKFFFHSGIDREYGGDISSLTVKGKIKQLIQDEEPKKPLSDSELMRILNREGIHIARRTVAKYRDELSIPSSTDRKRIF